MAEMLVIWLDWRPFEEQDFSARKAQIREEVMKHIIALFAGALTIGCYAQALAQELPKEGKYSITYTSVNPSPTKAVSIGDRDISVSSSIMTALNDGGSGLLHNMAGRCNCQKPIRSQRPSKFAGSAIMPIGAGIKFSKNS